MLLHEQERKVVESLRLVFILSKRLIDGKRELLRTHSFKYSVKTKNLVSDQIIQLDF